jgi:asparagine synthase (glutamine-hydrolysing)
MCGIYGIFRSSARLSEVEVAWLSRAEEALRHRGPDGHRRLNLLEGRCALGHDRLSIIDLAGGAQPLSNEDGTVWIVCNGEIYNYIELRQGLLARGHRFATQSDCEVLVHLYEEKGPALLEDLEGMFAFAIVDTRNESIFLARDRFGEKPLYWAELQEGGIAFASEMKALRELPGVDRRVDVAALAQFLALRYIPAPRTHWQGIRKLRAGEQIVLRCGESVQPSSYWHLRFSDRDSAERAGDPPLPVEDAPRELWQRLVASVRLRLRSDVPVGAFLSGGIDSTAIAYATRQLMPSTKFHTFCAAFEDTQLNEAPYARRIAERLGTEHEEVKFSTPELLENLDSLVTHFDEPFADASMLPTFAVCRAARRSCTVMLSGDGGDEFLGGYREFFRYSGWNRLRRFPGVNQAAGAVRKPWTLRRGAGLLEFLSRDDQALLAASLPVDEVLALFHPGHHASAQRGIEELLLALGDHARLPFPVSIMESTATSYLPEQILVKVDRASMASAQECRAPFLDRGLVEFLLRLPESYHFADGQGKVLLRTALPAGVPDDIRWREKQGFTPPLAAWMRSSLKEKMREALDTCRQQLGEILDLDPIQYKLEQHWAGADHSDELFRWFALSRTLQGAILS